MVNAESVQWAIRIIGKPRLSIYVRPITHIYYALCAKYRTSALIFILPGIDTHTHAKTALNRILAQDPNNLTMLSP